MRYHLYTLGCVVLASVPVVSIAQTAPAPTSARELATQVEDERERLTAEQARIAKQLVALPVAAKADAKADPRNDDAAAEPASPEDGFRSFAGLRLGVGLSFTLDVGKLDRISEAQIVEGVVRVTDQDNGRARIMLESHYFFTPCGDFLGIDGLAENLDQTPDNGKCDSEDQKRARWGWGPFVAIQPGSGEIIDAIGMGIMVGFRRDGKSTQSFNLGLGVVIDPNTHVLGDGFRANQPPPGNETEVRYRETLQTGLLFLTSFSF